MWEKHFFKNNKSIKFNEASLKLSLASNLLMLAMKPAYSSSVSEGYSLLIADCFGVLEFFLRLLWRGVPSVSFSSHLVRQTFWCWPWNLYIPPRLMKDILYSSFEELEPYFRVAPGSSWKRWNPRLWGNCALSGAALSEKDCKQPNAEFHRRLLLPRQSFWESLRRFFVNWTLCL